MPTIEVEGQRVQVDESFNSLPPEQQQRTVNEIAAAIRSRQAGQTSPGRMVTQGMSGVNEGIASALGFPVDVANLALRGSESLMENVTGRDLPSVQIPAGGSQTFRDLMTSTNSILPESQVPIERFVRRVGQDVGAGIIPGVGFAARAGRPLATLASDVLYSAGSGAGAATAQSMGDAGIIDDNPFWELAGSILGVGSVAGLSAAGSRLITPNPASPARLEQADVLESEGVELSAGQRTGSKPLQYFESEMGGAQIADLTERQAEQFTQAALRRAGINANRATPEVLNRAYLQMGVEFDRLAAQNTVLLDNQFVSDISSAAGDYASVVPDTLRSPIVSNLLTEFQTALQNSVGRVWLGGEGYQSLRSRLETLARNTKNNVELAQFFREFRESLDDAAERSIAQNNPADVGAWRQVRNDYRNFLAIERAATGGGESSALGLISPAQLRMAAVQQSRRNYALGRDDLGDLARAGVATMTPLPQSGTAPRQAAQRLLMGLPTAGAGGTAGLILGGPVGAAAGAALGLAAPSVVRRATLSPLGQRYLGNQLIPQGTPLPRPGAGTGAALVINEQPRPLRIDVWNTLNGLPPS